MCGSIRSQAGNNTRRFNDYPEMEYTTKLMSGGNERLSVMIEDIVWYPIERIGKFID
jgi:hypothetical protein